MQRGRISVLLLMLVAIVATGVHLYLYHEAWAEQGESVPLRDWL